MSWSYRILILYLGFVGIILSLVFTCFGEKVELESKDYYAKELRFQEQINASQNANDLDTPIAHEVRGKTVELQIPLKLLHDLKGEVYFFRPSDSGLDKTIILQPDADGRCVISDPGFKAGMYRMRISFTSADKMYYKEEVINLK